MIEDAASNDFERAIDQARRVIHDNEVESLKPLLAAHPLLLAWRGDERNPSLIEMATDAYGDAFGPEREHWFTRGTCAELLIDAGAVVLPHVADGLLESRAVGLLHMFERKRLLPRTLPFFAALGDLENVRSALAGSDRATVDEAFLTACAFEQRDVASLLLDRSAAAEPLIESLIENRSHYFSRKERPLEVFRRQQIHRALHDGDLPAFIDGLQQAPWLLGGAAIGFQQRLIEQCAFFGRGEFLSALLDRNPAVLQHPPETTKAFEHALTYAKTSVVPQLTRVWPFPDDVAHHAGMGNLARVKELLGGAAAIEQRALDVALAYAVVNRHFEVADLLLAHGADINTDWNSHEPASILHHLVFMPDPYPAMQYLIDRGIDMTIEDHRWKSTAAGWAHYGNNDPGMAEWLRSRLYTK